MDIRAWERCADQALHIDDFMGQPCWIGIDLASKVDIASMAVLFEREGKVVGFVRHFLPEDTVFSAGNSQYQGWMLSGRLFATPGNVTDFGLIEAELLDWSERFEVKTVAFDPFQATQFSTRMLAQGLPMVEVRPTVLNFSEAMKQLEALVLQGRWAFDGDPVLTWMVSNVVCHRDAKDNIYPRKERPENKIDGVVAILMALSRMLLDSGDNGFIEQGFVDL